MGQSLKALTIFFFQEFFKVWETMNMTESLPEFYATLRAAVSSTRGGKCAGAKASNDFLTKQLLSNERWLWLDVWLFQKCKTANNFGKNLVIHSRVGIRYIFVKIKYKLDDILYEYRILFQSVFYFVRRMKYSIFNCIS